jgi:polar amino acid transport system substrate-binding protein
MTRLKTLLAGCVLGTAMLCAAAAIAQEPPAAGASPRVDAIRKAGVLRVGVLANAPWLVENTSGSGDQWSGPAWLLAGEYARLLGVKLSPVMVSHETKVPVLAANQVDLSITRPGGDAGASEGCRFRYLLAHQCLHVRSR